MQKRGKEIFKHVHKDNLFHTECDCNMYTTVYKALFQSISVTDFLIDQPLLEEVLLFSQNTLNYFSPSAPNHLEVV